MLQANTKLKGRVQIHIGDELVRDIDNLVVDIGKGFDVSRLFSNTEFGPLTYIAVGSGSSPVLPSDSGIGTELARRAFDVAPARNGNACTVRSTFPAGVGTGTIREAGLFNAAAGGIMLSRVRFGDVPKTAGEPMSVTWIITSV